MERPGNQAVLRGRRTYSRVRSGTNILKSRNNEKPSGLPDDSGYRIFGNCKPMIMKLLAIYNIKGGVGKTATAVNMAWLAAADGLSTLLIDLDPQAASSFYFNSESDLEEKDVKKLMRGDFKIQKAVKGTGYPGLDILPAGPDHRKIETLLNDLRHAERWLDDLVQPFEKDYDLIILDCPPNLTLLTESIFRNCDFVLVPVVPTILSVRTYDQIKTYFKQHRLSKDKLLPFFSMFEKRKSLHNETVREFARQNKESVSVLIPYSAEVEKMGVYRAPLTFKKPQEDASKAFRKLWKAVKKHLGF